MARKMQKSLPWMPVDSLLFGPFFAFGHVQGIARIFLTVEMILAVLIVFGTLSILLLTVL
jgi:hypothetical protein